MITLWVRTKPHTLGFGADVFAGFGVEKTLEVSQVIVIWGRSVDVADVVGSVVVHAVEIVTSFNESGFFGSEGGETIAQLLNHRGGVMAEVDRVGEPRDGEFEFAFSSFDVAWICWVPRICGITYR